MLGALPKMCGVYQIKLGEEDATHPMRLHPDDVAGETIPFGPHKGEAIEPGAYQAGQDAIDHFRPKITARLRKTPAIDDNGDVLCKDATLIHKDGQVVVKDPTPVMTLRPDQEANGHWLL